MALLTFPTAPVNGQVYPVNPPAGINIYQWSSPDQTWRLLGTATGVTAGCYGDALTIPTFCVDSVGRITSVVNTPAAAQDLQTVTTAGATTTDSVTVGGLTAAGLIYPAADGAANEVMTTDGAGNLGWLATAQVVTTPTASADPGTLGQIAFGTGLFYWHDGTQWLQVAGSTF